MKISQGTIGTAATILGVVLMALIYFLGRTEKALSYTDISIANVIEMLQELAPDMEFAYGGEILPDLTVHWITLRNSGNVPIRPTDFEREIEIDFGPESKVHGADIEHTWPENLAPELITGVSNVAIEPLLLNPGDDIALRMYVSGGEGAPNVDARIAGVSTIEHVKLDRERRQTPPKPLLLAWGLVTAFLWSFYAFAATLSARDVSGWLVKRLFSLSPYLVGFLMGVGIYQVLDLINVTTRIAVMTFLAILLSIIAGALAAHRAARTPLENKT